MQRGTTYRDLAEYINGLTEEQKDCNVTVFVSGIEEYFPLDHDYPLVEAEGDDVLDDGVPYLAI